MTTYRIQAPDGKTYRIDGPPGASDAEVRAQVIAQNPHLGEERPVVQPDTQKFDPLEGTPWYERMAIGAGQRMNEMYNRGRQLMGSTTAQADIDEAKRLDAPLKKDLAANVGSVGTDISTMLIPGTVAMKGMGLLPKLSSANTRLLPGLGISAAGGAAQSAATEPIASDETLGEKMLGGAVGGAVGRVGANVAGRIISPFRDVNPVRSAQARMLEEKGVPVSPSQATDTTMARVLEDVSLWSQAGGKKQKQAFTNAVAKEVGLPPGPISGDAVRKANREAQDTIERYGERPNVRVGEDEMALTKPGFMTPESRPTVTYEEMLDANRRAMALQILSRDGVVTPEGLVNPARLASAIPMVAREESSFNKLATAGGSLAEKPDSNYWLRRLFGVGLLTGGGYGAIGPLGALASVGATAATNTKTGRRYLSNQVVPNNPLIADILRRGGTMAGADINTE